MWRLSTGFGYPQASLKVQVGGQGVAADGFSVGGMGAHEVDAERKRRTLEQIGPVRAVWFGEAGTAHESSKPPWLDEPEQPPDSRWRQLIRKLPRIRVDPGPRGVMALAVLGLVAMVIAGLTMYRERPEVHAVPPLPSAPAMARSAELAPAPIVEPELVVSVVGLVPRPGLQRLPAGSRITDAIAAAGGAGPGADLLSIDLAQRLTDGDQILIGAASAAPIPGEAPSSVKAGTATGSTTAARNRPAGKVNLNTATEQALDALPGVGPATAASIVEWRRMNGRFRSIDQLGQIQGIGAAKLTRLRPWVTL